MKTSSDELSRLGVLALSRAFGDKPRIAHALLHEFHSVEALFRLSEKERTEILGPWSKFHNCLNDSVLEQAAKDLDELGRMGAGLLGIEDAAYPKALKECPDAPLALYYHSASPPEDIFSRPMISIVGTRDISPYGREWTVRIVQSLARTQNAPTIVSGLAYGVDGLAHGQALNEKIPTIAVLPTGIEKISPGGHYNLARNIRHTKNCALVSDLPLHSTVVAPTFIRRNRIIAGLSSASIVIESRAKGGSLITAHDAFNYGRDVYALPGRLGDIRSEGCNNLIAEKVAEILNDPGMLCRKLGLRFRQSAKPCAPEEHLRSRYAALPEDTLEDLCLIVRTVMENRGIDVEQIASLTGLDYGRVTAGCSLLQKDGILQLDLLQRCIFVAKFT